MSNSNESYIREHKLKQLMEFLMEQLLNKKPSNPEKYLIKILERRQSLLAEKPKTVSFKGSSDPSNFIFEINVGKSRIRHRTTLKLNDEFLDGLNSK